MKGEKEALKEDKRKNDGWLGKAGWKGGKENWRVGSIGYEIGKIRKESLLSGKEGVGWNEIELWENGKRKIQKKIK